ncbi:ABC transporter permease [Priestia koreensis]|uniref:ABC transporter permease n=1 Tax=Priestia koreensis TaxID=284581 RepID=UPI00203E512D|nr:ABC-2 family transporter protein [Priestia koreensis]MCM3005404.1 ABC-2 family transporter protein [Priestia koreensis]
MRKYWHLLKSQMQIETAYMAWYWADTISGILRLFIMYFFWAAVFQNRQSVGELTFQSMITYVIIAMTLEAFVAGVGKTIAQDIKGGNIALELLKPYDYLTKLIWMDFGSKINGFVRSALPILLLSFLFLDITKPASLLAGCFFIPSMVAGILIGTQIDLIIGVLAFWTVNIWGLGVLREAIVKFFSGALIPLTLFPGWFQEVSQWLPFQSMIYVPVGIYTGQISGGHILTSFAIQCVWLLAIYVIVRVMWQQAVKRITVFGG